jgi:hypothetical protein
MKKLDKVTLISIDGVNPENALKALLHCMKYFEFASVKLLSFREPLFFDRFEHVVNFHQIEKLTYSDYSRFKINKICNYIETDYCLIIEPDGFIVNPEMWRDEFLHYDYIGAPWPMNSEKEYQNITINTRVGNGGFCLRSKKLLEVCRNINHNVIEQNQNDFDYENSGEDAIICRKNYNLMLQNGIKFAPLDVALKFSVEAEIEEYDKNQKTLGFHGKYHFKYKWKEILDKIDLEKFAF